MTEPHSIDERGTEMYRKRQELVGRKQQVLDHGFVTLIDFMGDDATIIDAARMSTQGGFVSWEPYEKHPEGDLGLLNFLWRKKHATPFEMCEVVFEVRAPIFVFREWHRHRTQSYNEASARYSQMPDIHYVPSVERLRPVESSNKQAGGIEGKVQELVDLEGIKDLIEGEQDKVYENYQQFLGAGVPKEVARVNTPVARYSTMRAKTDLRNWLGFLNLRMRPNAQWEIRQYAEAVAEVIKRLYPRTWELFEEHDLYGTHFSQSEMRIIRNVLSGVPLNEALADAKIVGKKKEEIIAKIQKGGVEIQS